MLLKLAPRLWDVLLGKSSEEPRPAVQYFLRSAVPAPTFSPSTMSYVMDDTLTILPLEPMRMVTNLNRISLRAPE